MRNGVDTTAHENWSAALIEGERPWREVYEHSPSIGFVVDPVCRLLSVTMGEIRDRPRVLSISAMQDGPKGVCIAVRDCGIGLNGDNLDRLWAIPNQPAGAVFQFTLRAGESQAS